MVKSRILIVDESSDVAVRFKPALTEEGFEVNVVHSLHEAFHSAKNSKPDIILVNDVFHKHSGYEICSELRGETDTCYAEIILFLPVVDSAAGRHASEVGINEVMLKSARPKELIERLHAMLDKR